MANLYVRSTDGSDGDSGLTWALAKATLAGASAISAAGDTIWISQAHAESTAAALAFDWNGTLAAPVRILCGNDAAEPPTALATGAVIETTGNSSIDLTPVGTAEYIYMYGLTVRCGSGSASSPDLALNTSNGVQRYEQCTFEMAATGSSSDIEIAPPGCFGETLCKNCNFKFANTSQSIHIAEAPATILGGALLAGSTPTGLFHLDSSGIAFVEGFDLSAVGATVNLGDTAGAGNKLFMRNCKMPASWSGSVFNGTPASDCVYELSNTSDAGAEYRYQRKTPFGTIDDETTIVRSGGATDGVRQLSWKLVSNANTEWNHQTLTTAEMVRWNETVGSSVTVTVEIVHDFVTNLTNHHIWLEVQYLGTSGQPVSTFIDDSSGDYLSSAANQTDSSASWTTTGMANPNTQQLSVTFTPQEPGFISAVVRLAQFSKTVYVCPKMDVTGATESPSEAHSPDGSYLNAIVETGSSQRQLFSGAYMNTALDAEDAVTVLFVGGPG